MSGCERGHRECGEKKLGEEEIVQRSGGRGVVVEE